ncbi:MAG: carboxylating nicotinate-nucleotide diphosphorylase [Nitrospira sp.]|nr:carboxylating nicotinate-nucleotide diphosphorylase [Nitrospira sp.]MCP9476257.1 carboxylating nicotinate-nucleotide diphosphorylase [Nitrospira sp.]
MTRLPAAEIRRAVRIGLEEDLGRGDVTTRALFPRAIPAQAVIIAQEPLVVAGLSAAVQTFLAVDPSLAVTVERRDGESAKKGQTVLRVTGDGRSILQAERVALNFLQHLSGIATLTRKFCLAVRGYPVRIMDTRKTLPGWRALQKWAVRLGGGVNHRMSLQDGILIKDNHLALLHPARQAVRAACRLAAAARPSAKPIIIEAESLPQVRQALAGKTDIILLDNMSPSLVRRAVRLINGRAIVEVSGGVTLKNVRAMAAAGADRISIGALTHSAPAAPFSLILKPFRNRRSS